MPFFSAQKGGEILNRFLKTLPPSAKRLLFVLDEKVVDPVLEDGGPGSGNWGHKGRPGLRGGSGKGGGKAMRTGTAATGFSSIKKDPAFKGVREAAKAYTPQAFWNLLQQDPAADKALRDQHKACGTKESLSDYQKRIYDMIHKSTEQEKAYKEKEARTIKEQAEAALAKRHKIATVPNDAPLTYKRRPQQFQHEINDVMNQYGLDGKPKLMSRKDFDQYRRDHPNDPLFFRTYRAQDKKELADYDKRLNEGEWYVDCSHGGAQYGQGMYCVGVYDRTKDYWQGVKTEMGHYGALAYGSNLYHTRAMMLDPSAKIFTPSQRANAYYGERQIREQLLSELKQRPEMLKNTKVFENSDQYIKTPEYQQVNKDETSRMIGTFDVYWQEYETRAQAWGMTGKQAMADFKMSTVFPQMKILRNMPRNEREKMISDFVSEVNEARVRAVAMRHAGEQKPTVYSYQNGQWQYVPSWSRYSTREKDLSHVDINAIKDIARKHTKTKQMADLLTKLYYNKNGLNRNSIRAGLDYDKIVNENARNASSYENMNAGALAALMGYDAINAHGHGQTGSYTVILNRTKLILSEDPVNLHGYWKG